MPDVAEVWKDALPKVKQGVTGVGVWSALNACSPIALENGVFVLGMPYEESDLAGHLRVPQTSRLIEKIVGELLKKPVKLRVIEGAGAEEWERVKRKDQEAQRLQKQAAVKEREALQARSSWEGIYESLGRTFAAVPNKSLPQNRARFLGQAVQMLAEAKKAQSGVDEYSERNFARCIERIAQYTEAPSAVVAAMVLEAAGEL